MVLMLLSQATSFWNIETGVLDQGNGDDQDDLAQPTAECVGVHLHRKALTWLCQSSSNVWHAARKWQQLHPG